MADIETIAKQARDRITNDDESVWLDLPQIINLVHPALSAFFEQALKDNAIVEMFPTEQVVGEIGAFGVLDLAAEISRPYMYPILDKIEILIDGWPHAVRLVPTLNELNTATALDPLHIKAYRVGGTLHFGPNTTGAFGGNTMAGQFARFQAPKVDVDLANLPPLLEGRFVMFLADFVKDQILKRP